MQTDGSRWTVPCGACGEEMEPGLSWHRDHDARSPLERAIDNARGLCALLCAHLAALSAHVADLLRLYGVVRPQSALGGRQAPWREQRRLWRVLAALCAAAALAWVGIGLGWW